MEDTHGQVQEHSGRWLVLARDIRGSRVCCRAARVPCCLRLRQRVGAAVAAVRQAGLCVQGCACNQQAESQGLQPAGGRPRLAKPGGWAGRQAKVAHLCCVKNEAFPPKPGSSPVLELWCLPPSLS